MVGASSGCRGPQHRGPAPAWQAQRAVRPRLIAETVIDEVLAVDPTALETRGSRPRCSGLPQGVTIAAQERARALLSTSAVVGCLVQGGQS